MRFGIVDNKRQQRDQKREPQTTTQRLLPGKANKCLRSAMTNYNLLPEAIRMQQLIIPETSLDVPPMVAISKVLKQVVLYLLRRLVADAPDAAPPSFLPRGGFWSFNHLSSFVLLLNI
jgi:hypothetical protein